MFYNFVLSFRARNVQCKEISISQLYKVFVKGEITEKKTEVSIIISVFNKRDDLFNTLTSLYNSTKIPFEVIVVSAISTDGTDEMVLEKFPQVRLVKADDVGWGEGNNIGASSANGEYFFFSGADMMFEEGWLEDLLITIQSNTKIGSVGNLLRREYEKSGLIFSGGLWVSLYGAICRGVRIHQITKDLVDRERIEVDAVSYPLISRQVFFSVGGFDPIYFYAGDEIDLCYRIKERGFSNILSTKSFVSTAATFRSKKTDYFWNRSCLRMVSKFCPRILLPILYSYLALRIFFLAGSYFIKGDFAFSRKLIGVLTSNVTREQSGSQL